MGKKTTKSHETAGEVKDVNATPCPKCQQVDALTWYSQELGEQMRGCVKCKYQNTVDLWDSQSLKVECESIVDEMDAQDTHAGQGESDEAAIEALYAMNLHESKTVSESPKITLLRVESGWVYHFGGQPVFVPQSNLLSVEVGL